MKRRVHRPIMPQRSADREAQRPARRWPSKGAGEHTAPAAIIAAHNRAAAAAVGIGPAIRRSSTATPLPRSRRCTTAPNPWSSEAWRRDAAVQATRRLSIDGPLPRSRPNSGLAEDSGTGGGDAVEDAWTLDETSSGPGALGVASTGVGLGAGMGSGSQAGWRAASTRAIEPVTPPRPCSSAATRFLSVSRSALSSRIASASWRPSRASSDRTGLPDDRMLSRKSVMAV